MPAGQRRGLAKWLLILAVGACGRFQRQACIVGAQHPVADHNAQFDLSAGDLPAGGANEAFPLLSRYAFSPSSTGDRVIRHCVKSVLTSLIPRGKRL